MIRVNKYLSSTAHIAPLAVLRVLFGAMMFTSLTRFWLLGRIEKIYLQPGFFFQYYGFEWVKPLGAAGTYILFGLAAIAALFVMLGLFYRASAIIFFMAFSYIELIDKSTYLNHYYFISIIAFLLILLPANRYFSVDVLRKPSIMVTQIPAWMVDIFKLQLAIVYFYAGIAKLNYDWMVTAMPLSIWLPSRANLPIIGELLTQKWVAYFFSWGGALYDIVIPFLLFSKRTRGIAYVFVVVFHLATALILPVIGMFPYIMIITTLIFFPAEVHKKVIQLFSRIFSFGNKRLLNHRDDIQFSFLYPVMRKLVLAGVAVFFAFQLLFPLRYMLYPGNLFWTEEGYRFSWRVMLMEKGGTAFFYVKDAATGKESEVATSMYLSRQQEKMMATQPDMILQFAQFIATEYEKKGYTAPQVRVESYVTLNGSGTRSFINSTVNLAAEKESFASKSWILPFEGTTMNLAQK